MKRFSIFWATALVLILSACTDVFFFFFFFLRQPYWVLLDPAQLGYEVDNQGRITVVGNNAYVQVAPGRPEVVWSATSIRR